MTGTGHVPPLSFGRLLEEFDDIRIRECWVIGDVRRDRNFIAAWNGCLVK